MKNSSLLSSISCHSCSTGDQGFCKDPVGPEELWSVTQGSGSEDGVSWDWLSSLQSELLARPSPILVLLQPEQRGPCIPLRSPGTSQGHGVALAQDTVLPAQGCQAHAGGQESPPPCFPVPRPFHGSGCEFAEHAIKLNLCQGRTRVGCGHGGQGMCGQCRRGFSDGSRNAGGK